MDRREFLKNCFKIGGYAGIACLGMGAIDDARGWGILPAVVTSGGGGESLADWDETSEAGLASDNTFVCMFENTVANGNETGQGAGLSGADLVLTCGGTIPGASGSPPSRALVGNTFFTCAPAMMNIIAGETSWTYILKVYYNTVLLNSTTIIMSATGYNIQYTTSNREFDVADQDGSEQQIISEIALDNTTYWICVWTDGVQTKAGLSLTKPTKLSDFNVNNLVTMSRPYDNMATVVGYNYANPVGIDYAYDLDLDAYYCVMSKTCLINNDM